MELSVRNAFDDDPTRKGSTDLVPHICGCNRVCAAWEDAGFVHLAHEWWHYALPGDYGLIDSAALGDLSPVSIQG